MVCLWAKFLSGEKIIHHQLLVLDDVEPITPWYWVCEYSAAVWNDMIKDKIIKIRKANENCSVSLHCLILDVLLDLRNTAEWNT